VIKNIRHTGIVVHNLKIMVDFYQKLGFEVESTAIEEGGFIEQVVNIENVKLEWVKMRAPDGCLLELLQYHTHPQQLSVRSSKSNDLGCSHLAYTVDDIESACDKIRRAGGTVGNSPATSPNGQAKVAYCHDPEGVLMEIVEVIE